MANSFSVTLVSNQNEEMFDHNTSSSFSNALPRSMDLSNYEVALESIYLTDHHPKEVALTTPEEPKMFFKLEDKDNELTVVQINTAELKIRKTSDSFVEFLDNINRTTAYVNMPITITKTLTGTEVTQISLTYTPSPGYQLFIHPPLNKVLGFTSNTFQAGTHVNDGKIDKDLFTTMPIGNVGELSEFSETRTQVEIKQIPEKPDLEVLVSFIQAALAEQKTDVRFEVDEKKSALSYEVKNYTKRVILSESLNTYLGQTPNFALIDKGSIRVPRNILFPSKIRPPPRTCSKLLVLCDLIQPQIYAAKEMPLLAVIDRKFTELATEISVEPKTLLYKAVQAGKFSQIKITLQSDNNELLKSQQNPTVVNLHFRKAMKDIHCDEKRSCKLVNMDIQLESDGPKDLILMDRSPSRSPSPVRFVVRRKPIKAAPGGKVVSSKKKVVGRGRPKQPSKTLEKSKVKRGRPAKLAQVAKPRGRPPTKQTKQTIQRISSKKTKK